MRSHILKPLPGVLAEKLNTFERKNLLPWNQKGCHKATRDTKDERKGL